MRMRRRGNTGSASIRLHSNIPSPREPRAILQGVTPGVGQPKKNRQQPVFCTQYARILSLDILTCQSRSLTRHHGRVSIGIRPPPKRDDVFKQRGRLRTDCRAIPRLLPRRVLLPDAIQHRCEYHLACSHGEVLTSKKCCPRAANCTSQLLQNPRCANETWDLYDNGGFFCCLKGMFGYAARVTNSNGCGSEGYVLKSGEVLLPLVRAGEGM